MNNLHQVGGHPGLKIGVDAVEVCAKCVGFSNAFVNNCFCPCVKGLQSLRILVVLILKGGGEDVSICS